MSWYGVALAAAAIATVAFYRANFSSIHMLLEFFSFMTRMLSGMPQILKLKSLEGKDYNFADYMEKIVDERPDIVQFITVEDGKEFTLRDIEQKANQIAHWVTDIGVQKGDTMGLLMLNRFTLFLIFMLCYSCAPLHCVQ
jgi:hypothetical protein